MVKIYIINKKNIDNPQAQWASINNGIFLCLKCSSEHRTFGYSISLIRSVTLDKWNEAQIKLIKCGGNERLKNFLLSFNINKNINKRKLYMSEIMCYYRRMLRAEANGEIFNEKIPKCFDLIENNDKYNNNFDNNNGNNNYNDEIGNNYIEFNNIKKINNKINITNEDNEYKKIDDEENNNNINEYQYYLNYVGNLFNNLKYNIYYISNSAFQILLYTGEKIYEKSTEGLNYIKNKLNNSGNYFDRNNNNINIDDNNGGEALIDKKNVFDS